MLLNDVEADVVVNFKILTKKNPFFLKKKGFFYISDSQDITQEVESLASLFIIV